MRVSIDKSKFVTLIEDFVKTAKIMFNFLCDGETLQVEVLGEFTVYVSIECTYIDGERGVYDISHYIHPVMHLLNKDEDIILDFSENSTKLKQGNFSCTLLKEFEGRKELEVPSNEEFKKLNVKRLKYLMASAKSMMPVAKELKLLPVDPMFSQNKFYNSYSNIAFIEDYEFTDMCIPYNVISQVTSKLKDSAEYAFINGNEQLVIKSGGYYFYLFTTNYNLRGHVTTALTAKMMECREIASMSLLRDSDKLSLMINVLKEQKFTVSVSREIFCIEASSNDGTASIFIGDNKLSAEVSFTLTPAQMDVVYRMFGEDESFKVFAGDNCIRFNKGTRNLLIAVLTY